MKILGISCFYHESAACLVIDGKLVAASEEERFTRNKHDFGFPINAVNFCLDFSSLTISDIDYVVFYEKPFIKFERSLTLSLRYFPRSYGLFVESTKNFLTEKLWVKSIIASKLNVDSNKILFVPHHVSHAASSYYTSPFKKAAFLTLDGVGEWSCGSWGKALDNKLKINQELRFPNSAGLLYSAFTAFLGFEVNDGEYKVMGMAAYGKPILKDLVKKTYKQFEDGSIELNLDYFSFQYSVKKMYTKEFETLFKGHDKNDIAASLQSCFEEIILNLVNFVYSKTKEENLVFAGGVALNSVINALIIQKTKFKNIFIFPAAGDDGGCVGAALFVYYHVLNNKLVESFDNAFLGLSFSLNEIEDFLKQKKIKYKFLKDQELIKYTARKLSENKVIGWFENKEEFGPRALGHRSILANPKDKKMKDIVNSKIKFREEFRPFAPAILSEYAKDYYYNLQPNLTKFMLGTFIAKKAAKENAAATVHEDDSSRVQVIKKDYHGKLRKVLEEFYRITKIPVLLNTSFNLKGEPIVHTPENAYNTFINSGIDILVLENLVIEK